MQADLNKKGDEMIVPQLVELTNMLGFTGIKQRMSVMNWAASKRAEPLIIPNDGPRPGATFGKHAMEDGAMPVFPVTMGKTSHLRLRRLDWIRKTDPERIKKAQEAIEGIDLTTLTDRQKEILKTQIQPVNELVNMCSFFTASCMFRGEQMPSQFVSVLPESLDLYVNMVITQRNKSVYVRRTSLEEHSEVFSAVPYKKEIVEGGATTYLGLVARYSQLYYPSFEDIYHEEDLVHTYYSLLRSGTSVSSYIAVKSFICAASTFMDLPVPKAFHLADCESESVYLQAMDFLTDTPVVKEVNLQEPSTPARPTLRIIT